jgi:hypothetical protein
VGRLTEDVALLVQVEVAVLDDLDAQLVEALPEQVGQGLATLLARALGVPELLARVGRDERDAAVDEPLDRGAALLAINADAHLDPLLLVHLDSEDHGRHVVVLWSAREEDTTHLHDGLDEHCLARVRPHDITLVVGVEVDGARLNELWRLVSIETRCGASTAGVNSP